MEIQEFVKKILVGIDGAVEDARVETKRDIHFSESKGQRTVEFDIAVSVEEKTGKNAKASIKVLQFFGGAAGANKENKNMTVSRIKFGVHIDQKTKKERSTPTKKKV